MIPFFYKKKQPKPKEAEIIPIIDVSIVDVRKAVRKFCSQLPKGTYRTILVKDDFSIDFTQLVNHIGGIPSKNFYMSRETYDIFEEKDKRIPEIMDKVQKAVDQYVEEKGKLPINTYDRLRKVNYYELIRNHYLDFFPDIDFYITIYDGIITHIKPKNK